ncbi:MAG: mechanosensitive ion channel family protein [Urechidicola sp.]|nr:mechanosensitive ion channel family protein [Urechidicola sp.]
MHFKFISALFITFFLGLSSFSQDSLNVNLPKPNIISASVVLKSDTLFYIKSSPDSYPVKIRAQEISSKLEDISKWYIKSKDSIYLKSDDNYVIVMYNDITAFIVTKNDAKHHNTPILNLASTQMNSLTTTLNKSTQLSIKEWLKRIGYFALSFIVLISFIKLVNWLFRRLDKRLAKIEKSFLRKNRNIIKYFIPSKTANIFVFLSKIIRIIIIGITLIAFAPFMFSFFPWAEHMVHLFYGYIETPVKYVLFGFINFIPSLFFIIIIAIIARYIVRVASHIATDVELGKFNLPNFHKDWAKPTQKIFSILVYAISLVMIFPYLPGSGSTAFQGVSIFIGAIISFGSTSAIANIIAGIVITYMRPFQLGDRVKIDNVVGDVISKTILVTHIRTAKNEDVTIPNANILIGKIINYSNNREKTIILHTTITLGYDLPWQTANELLIKAANQTIHIEKEPEPFVLQTSLDDYYVSYQLNAHTKEAKKMPLIYSELHKHILEVFNEAGVEILSPHYMAARDGSLTTVPSQLKPTDKSPIQKIADHLTGRNQKITISKPDSPKEE